MKLLKALVVAGLALGSSAFSIGGKSFVVKKDCDGLQNLVSYDIGSEDLSQLRKQC